MSGVLKYLCLRSSRHKDLIKCILPRLLLILPHVLDTPVIGDLEGKGLPLVLLKLKQGPYSAVHSDLALDILQGIEQALALDLSSKQMMHMG